MVLVDFKGYFQGQKGPIWTFVIYLGETVHAVTNVCMKHIIQSQYDLSVDLVIFDLGLPL